MITAHPLCVEARVRIPGKPKATFPHPVQMRGWTSAPDGTARMEQLHPHTKEHRDPSRTIVLDACSEDSNLSLGNSSPQHAPSFEGKSSKHTHTLGFDYLFLKWINWIKQTSCSEEIRCFGSTALLSTTSTSTVAERSEGLLHPGSQK